MMNINTTFMITLFLMLFYQSVPSYSDIPADDSGACVYDAASQTIREVSDMTDFQRARTSTSLLNPDPYGNLCRNSCKSKRYKPISVIIEALSIHRDSTSSYIISMNRDKTEADFDNLDVENKASISVGNIQGLREAILTLNDQCFYIDSLTIDSHGSKGFVRFEESDANGFINVNNISTLDGLSCAFGHNAKVRLLGCSVGRGISGKYFLRELGKRLLHTHGGSVTAANDLVVSHPVFPTISADFKYNTFSIDPGGRNERFSDGVLSFDKELEELDRHLERLDQILDGNSEIKDQKTFHGMMEYHTLSKSFLLEARELYLRANKLGGIDKLNSDEQLKLSQLLHNGYYYFDKFVTASSLAFKSKPERVYQK